MLDKMNQQLADIEKEKQNVETIQEKEEVNLNKIDNISKAFAFEDDQPEIQLNDQHEFQQDV